MKQEDARAGVLSRHYGPQVPPPPPEQVRPVSQTPPLQHRWVLPPQAPQVLAAPPVAGRQVILSAVQNGPPPPPVPVQHGSPDPPQPPASPMQAPASHTPLLLGQSAFSATQVPKVPPEAQQPPPLHRLPGQQELPAPPQASQVAVPPVTLHTELAAVQVRFAPVPQQGWPMPPQAVQVDVAEFPLQAVPAAVQLRFPAVPQQSSPERPQATQLSDASPTAHTAFPAVQMVPQHGSPRAPQVPASDAQTPCSHTPPPRALEQALPDAIHRRVPAPPAGSQQPPLSQIEPGQHG